MEFQTFLEKRVIYLYVYFRQHFTELREHKPELQRKYSVSTLGVFGCWAREEATDQSDIDTAVEFTSTWVSFYCTG